MFQISSCHQCHLEMYADGGLAVVWDSVGGWWWESTGFLSSVVAA